MRYLALIATLLLIGLLISCNSTATPEAPADQHTTEYNLIPILKYPLTELKYAIVDTDTVDISWKFQGVEDDIFSYQIYAEDVRDVENVQIVDVGIPDTDTAQVKVPLRNGTWNIYLVVNSSKVRVPVQSIVKSLKITDSLVAVAPVAAVDIDSIVISAEKDSTTATVTIEWEEPASDLRYAVYWSDFSGAALIDATKEIVAQGSTSITLSSLPLVENTYAFWIAAINSAGQMGITEKQYIAPVEKIFLIVEASTALDTPHDVDVVSTAKIDLSWRAVGVPVSKLCWWKGSEAANNCVQEGTGEELGVIWSTNGSRAIISGLELNVEYTVKVIAEVPENSDVVTTEEEISAEVVTTTPVNDELREPPTEPREIELLLIARTRNAKKPINANSLHDLKVSWTAPEDSGVGADGLPAVIEEYVVHQTYESLGRTVRRSIQQTGSAEILNVHGFWFGTELTVKVCAINSAGLKSCAERVNKEGIGTISGTSHAYEPDRNASQEVCPWFGLPRFPEIRRIREKNTLTIEWTDIEWKDINWREIEGVTVETEGGDKGGVTKIGWRRNNEDLNINVETLDIFCPPYYELYYALKGLYNSVEQIVEQGTRIEADTQESTIRALPDNVYYDVAIARASRERTSDKSKAEKALVYSWGTGNSLELFRKEDLNNPKLFEHEAEDSKAAQGVSITSIEICEWSREAGMVSCTTAIPSEVSREGNSVFFGVTGTGLRFVDLADKLGIRVSITENGQKLTRVVVVNKEISKVTLVEDELGVPYIPLYTAADFPEIVSNRNYILMNDVEFSVEQLANDFFPIGKALSPFKGRFVGGGYTISGLHIDHPERDNIGLFGYVLGAVIEDVTITNSTIIGRDNVGGLVGSAIDSRVSGSTSGRITGREVVGGLVGSAIDSTVSGNTSGRITGRELVGGLVGRSEKSTITGSADIISTVVGTWLHTGGLVGSAIDSTVSGNTSGRITGLEAVGGLVGTVTDSTVSGSTSGGITGRDLVGGLVGTVTDSTVSGSTSGGISGVAGVGGLVGSAVGSTIDSSTVSGSTSGRITGRENVGGLVGYSERGTITASGTSSTVEGTWLHTGGLVGFATDSTVSGSTSGRITGRENVGGLVGYSERGTITASETSSTVEGTWLHTGGLVGFATDSTVSGSTSAAVTGSAAVGGLVGSATDSTVSGSTSGTTKGSYEVGGLVGTASDSVVTGYASGETSGNPKGKGRVGGLVGYSLRDVITGYTAANSVITGLWHVGGLAGTVTSSIIRGHTAGTISGSRVIGGLVGSFTGEGGSIVGYTHAKVEVEPIENSTKYTDFGLIIGSLFSEPSVVAYYSQEAQMSRVSNTAGVNGTAVKTPSRAILNFPYGDSVGEWTWLVGDWPRINMSAD